MSSSSAQKRQTVKSERAPKRASKAKESLKGSREYIVNGLPYDMRCLHRGKGVKIVMYMYEQTVNVFE